MLLYFYGAELQFIHTVGPFVHTISMWQRFLYESWIDLTFSFCCARGHTSSSCFQQTYKSVRWFLCILSIIHEQSHKNRDESIIKSIEGSVHIEGLMHMMEEKRGEAIACMWHCSELYSNKWTLGK